MQTCEEQRVTAEDRRELERNIKELEKKIRVYNHQEGAYHPSRIMSPKEERLVKELRILRRMR